MDWILIPVLIAVVILFLCTSKPETLTTFKKHQKEKKSDHQCVLDFIDNGNW